MIKKQLSEVDTIGLNFLKNKKWFESFSSTLFS